MHKHPTPETNRIDAMLNDLERWTGTLSPKDQRLTKEVAERRFSAHRAWGSVHGLGLEDESSYTLKSKIECLGAELFAFRKLNLEIPLKWIHGLQPDKSGDIGKGLQVRHTKYSTGRLIIHPEDIGRHTFFLVTGPFPTYRLAGWITVKEGQRQENWRELGKGRFTYAVSQDLLHEMKDFKIEH